MTARADRIIRVENLSFFIDEITDAPRVASLGVVASAIRQTNLSGGVAQQGEGKIALARERRIVRNGVEANA